MENCPYPPPNTDYIYTLLLQLQTCFSLSTSEGIEHFIGIVMSESPELKITYREDNFGHRLSADGQKPTDKQETNHLPPYS